MGLDRRLILHLDFYRDEDQVPVDEEEMFAMAERGIDKAGLCVSDYVWVDIPPLDEDIKPGHGDEPDGGACGEEDCVDLYGDLDPGKKVDFIIEVPPTALNFPGPYKHYVLTMMKNWWDMTIDNDWSDLLLAHFNRDIMGFTRYFVDATSEVFDREPGVRIQFKTVMQQIEVSYDTESEVGFRKATTVFNEMWLKHMLPLL